MSTLEKMKIENGEDKGFVYFSYNNTRHQYMRFNKINAAGNRILL